MGYHDLTFHRSLILIGHLRPPSGQCFPPRLEMKSTPTQANTVSPVQTHPKIAESKVQPGLTPPDSGGASSTTKGRALSSRKFPSEQLAETTTTPPSGWSAIPIAKQKRALIELLIRYVISPHLHSRTITFLTIAKSTWIIQTASLPAALRHRKEIISDLGATHPNQPSA